jgi:superfamily I DNA/RNA helicase
MTTFESQSEFLNVSNRGLGYAALDLKAIRRVAKVHFTTDCNEIKFSTIYSFKGWESKTVILILQNEISDNQDLDENLDIHSLDTTPAIVYTAITRARENLFILNLGNKNYHEFFNEKITNE